MVEKETVLYSSLSKSSCCMAFADGILRMLVLIESREITR